MRQETVLKIIGLLRKDIEQGLTILDISKKLHIGYRPAHNHVTALNKEGILIVKTVGRARQCFLNLENNKCRHLLQEVDMLRKEVIIKNNLKLRILDNLISKITQELIAEVHSVVLFGSYAKGSATKTSDVDLLFIVNDLKNKYLRAAIEQECSSYQYSNNIKISPMITDIAEFKKMIKAKVLNVGREAKEYGIPLYGFEQFWRLITWQEATS